MNDLVMIKKNLPPQNKKKHDRRLLRLNVEMWIYFLAKHANVMTFY